MTRCRLEAPTQPVTRRPGTVARFLVLLLALVCSGAAGLTYQVLWLRLLSLVFGVTAYAASTVLAGFMAGLAIGSLVAGRVAARASHPLRLFAAAEARDRGHRAGHPAGLASTPCLVWIGARLDRRRLRRPDRGPFCGRLSRAAGPDVDDGRDAAAGRGVAARPSRATRRRASAPSTRPTRPAPSPACS